MEGIMAPRAPRLSLAVLASVAGLALPALAQTPLTTAWTYQGKLTSNGLPVTSAVDLRLRLYNSETLGTGQVGVDLFVNNLTPVDGAFTTELNFGPTAFDGNRRWLEIAVRPAGSGSYVALTPRQELTATPYSLFAKAVAAGATPWGFSGANATYTGSGDVGVGTASPTARLHVVGADAGTGLSLNANNKFYVSGSFVGVNRSTSLSAQEAFGVQAPVVGNAYGGMYIRTDSATGKPFYGYANTGGQSMWTYLDGSDNSWRINLGSADRMTISSSGLVGIGTTSPASQLDIALSDKRLQFRLDSGLVPGINLAGTGGNLGILRLRNGLEIWPHDAGTAAGFLTIRNTTGTPTCSLDGSSGNSWVTGTLGVGTSAPEASMHVLKGTAGTVSADSNSVAVLENSGRAYLSILTPAADERGILFGDPTSSADGGIIYNTGSTPDGFQFRTSGNQSRMALSSAGNLGIGTNSPSQRLDVRSTGGTDFTVNPGSLFGAVTPGTVTLDTNGVGTIGVWDNFSVSNNLAVSGSSTFTGSATFNAAGAPFSVASSTTVTNLSADLLDGLNSSAFLTAIPNPLSVSGGNAGIGTVTGINSSTALDSAGVRGFATGGVLGGNRVYGVLGSSTSDSGGAGVIGLGTRVSGSSYGVRGQSSSATAAVGVYGEATHSNNGGVGVWGVNNSGNAFAMAVSGDADAGRGVVGTSSSNDGVRGESISGAGVKAYTASGGTALYGERTANGNKGWFGGMNEGGWSESSSGDGFVAKAAAANRSGLYCENTNTSGNALYANGKAYFVGEVSVPVLTIRGGADLAEKFDIAAALEAKPVPGMIVSIDPGRPGSLVVSTTSYDTKVAGVITGANGVRPGLVLSQRDAALDGEHAVAMTGRVWCYADATYGAIAPGDRLTSSPTPGHAMRVSDESLAPGTVIGKAITPLPQGKQGMVLVLVNLQ